MDITTIIKAATAIQAGCALAIVGISAYAVKQQVELNRSIAEGTQHIADGNKMMHEFIASIK